MNAKQQRKLPVLSEREDFAWQQTRQRLEIFVL